MLGVVALIGLVSCGALGMRWWRLRPSLLVGLSSREIIDRCGAPRLALVRDPDDAPPLPGEPVWSRMDQAARDQLLGSPGFLFDYEGLMLGEHIVVRFRNGRVFEAHSASH